MVYVEGPKNATSRARLTPTETEQGTEKCLTSSKAGLASAAAEMMEPREHAESGSGLLAGVSEGTRDAGFRRLQGRPMEVLLT